jgi:hypothetical protein
MTCSTKWLTSIKARIEELSKKAELAPLDIEESVERDMLLAAKKAVDKLGVRLKREHKYLLINKANTPATSLLGEDTHAPIDKALFEAETKIDAFELHYHQES